MSETNESWARTEEELGLIGLIRDEVIQWRSFCQTAEHLLAIGAVVSGLDDLLSGRDPKSAARVSLDHLVGEESRSTTIMLEPRPTRIGPVCTRL